mgnify:CR=1 FL=1
MALWKRLRYKRRAIVRHPGIYAGHYGLAFFLRGCLFLVEFVFLRIFIYLPFRLADLSLREIMQHLRRMDIHFWSFLRSAFTRLLDVGHWVQGLGRFSSLPEALRYVNARLSDWLYWKRERLLVILRSLKSPREIYRHIRRFLDEHPTPAAQCGGGGTGHCAREADNSFVPHLCGCDCTFRLGL